MYRTHLTTRLEVGFPNLEPEEKRPRLKALGTHIVCELSGCDAAMLTDVEAVASMMVEAASRPTPPSSKKRSTGSSRKAFPASS